MLYGLAGNYSGGTFRYNPQDGTLAQWSSPFQYVPVALMHAIADPANGKVFVNAYLNGSTSVYDPVTGKSTVTTRQGQVEDWAWDNTGKLYVGIYPYGRSVALGSECSREYDEPEGALQPRRQPPPEQARLSSARG